MKIRISYTLDLKPHEFSALVELGREWGLDFGDATPRQIAKRALRNSGESGCLSEIPSKEPSSEKEAA